MTLTTRLSLFFLGALALVLVGFCTTLYLLAQTYLYRQADDRLEAALNTLVAAAEIGPDGVEWEPHERHLSLGQDTGDGPVLWTVTDARGRRLDGSHHTATEGILAGSSSAFAPDPLAKQVVRWRGQPWWVSQRQLRGATHSNLPAPVSQPRQQGEQGPKYPALVMTAGVPLEPAQTALRNLALALVGTSTGLWLLAAFVGRWLCRRALLPVTRMAATARTMGAADLGQRLPGAGTGDELEDLGRAFNGLLDRLHESFERQRRFTGDASHQLRTPLTVMLGQVEVALRRARSPEEYQRVLTSFQGQALHLRQIVEMLLFLARADAEAKLSRLEPIELAAWSSAHLQTWSGHSRAADLRLECSPDGPLWVLAQTSLLGQLVNNLVENACKYSRPGTPITLRLWGEKGAVCLALEDAGCGIAAEDLPHVFEPFYRSPQARHSGSDGIGLGLAVASRIAVAFGGSIGVESGPGQGSRFTVRFPQADPCDHKLTDSKQDLGS